MQDNGFMNAKHEKYYYHGLFMWIAWFLFGTVQLITFRWFRHLSSKLTIVHAISGLVILVLTVKYSYYLYMIPKALFTKGYFIELFTKKKYHKILALAVCVLIIFVSLGGLRSLILR
jgi:hypothetical protein